MPTPQQTSSQQTYRCAYCGAQQQGDGTGAAVCTQCGAAQPAKTAPVSLAAANHLQTVVAPIVLGGLIVIGTALYFVFHKTAASAPAPIVNSSSTSTVSTPRTSTPVPGSRIVRVENPHIRILPAGITVKPEDIVNTPEGTSSLSGFETRQLQVRTPRRLLDETGKPVFLGEVINTSPDRVAVAPTVTLLLTRGGKVTDKATRSFADIPPGAHVPLFFHYDGTTRPFDGMSFEWKPMQSYALGDPRHPRMTASVQSHQQITGDEALGRNTGYRFLCERVKGNVTNDGQRDTPETSVYTVLRDAQGQITGFDHGTIRSLSPGQSESLQLTPVILGRPVASVEMVALPVSAPSL